jgi:succinoglycan biosynthesis transport protein ExoP
LDLRQYTRVLRAHWLLIAASVVVCTVGALVLAFTRDPIYEAQSQLFVSNGVPTNLSDAYVGSLFTQQRVVSYALLVPSPAVVEGVIKELGLPDTVSEIQNEIHVTVPTGTVVIDLTVKDRSPERAQEIAAALGRRLAVVVQTLETTQEGQKSPVKVTVTSPPELPTHPISPQKSLFGLLGVLLGFLLGLGGAVLSEVFSRKVHDGDEAEAVADAPVLGTLPEPSGDTRTLVALNDPSSPEAEAYRRIRANLGGPPGSEELRSIVVASAGNGEPTAVIVANLGVVLAQAGHSVVLVDANLRRPALAEIMGVFAPVGGLIQVLENDLPLALALRSVAGDLPIKVLGSARLPPNPGDLFASLPSDLLGSPRCAAVLDELSKLADVVIIDAPPLLEDTDAAVLARSTSGVVLVTSVGATTVDQLESAARSLRAVNARLLGLVLRRSRSQLVSLIQPLRVMSSRRE